MKKENILFLTVGLLAGFIVGFIFTNSFNRSTSLQATTGSPANVPVLDGQSNSQTQSVSIKESAAGMQPEVAQTLERARNEPNNFEAQIKAGEMYARIQNLEKANEYLTKAVAAHSDTFEDLTTLGNGFFDVKNFEEAEKWYTLALAKNPDDADVRTDLGSTFMERAQPDLDRAIREYHTSLEKNPNHENTIFNLSLALMRKGDAAGAQAMLARLEKVNAQSPLIPRLRDRLNQPSAK